MKVMFPTKPIIEVLNSNSTTTLVFTPLTEAEYNTIKEQIHRHVSIPKSNFALRNELTDKFKSITGFGFDQIDAIGTTEQDIKYFNSVIEHVNIELAGVSKRSYKCFTSKDWKTRHLRIGINLHDDGGCAWNCLMEKLRQPTHGIVYKIPTTRAIELKLL